MNQRERDTQKFSRFRLLRIAWSIFVSRSSSRRTWLEQSRWIISRERKPMMTCRSNELSVPEHTTDRPIARLCSGLRCKRRGELFGCKILKHFSFNVCKDKTCCKQVLKSPHRLVYSLAHKYNNSSSEELLMSVERYLCNLAHPCR